MKNIRVDGLRTLKRETEEKIAQLIKEFEERSGFTVTKIEHDMRLHNADHSRKPTERRYFIDIHMT